MLRSNAVALLASLLVGCSVDAPGTGPQNDTGDPAVNIPPIWMLDSGTTNPPQGAGVDASSQLLDAQADLADAHTPGADASDVPLGADAAAPQDANGSDVVDPPGPMDADSPVDAAEDASPAADAEAEDDASLGCTLDGTFAAEVTFDVQWKGTTLAGLIPVLAAGAGHLRVIVRIDAQQVGGQTRWNLSACGADIPDFAASWLFGEVYSVEIPVRAWDQPTKPSWPLDWTFDCRAPGCAVHSAPFLATLGARFESPSEWPGAAGPVSRIVPLDHDNDKQPGITLRARGPQELSPGGKAYDLPPVAYSMGSRANTIFTALQMAARIDGTLESCDAYKGVLNEGRVEARALGCTAIKDGEKRDEPCTSSQATFVDNNFPNWVVTGGSVRAKRVAPESTCAAVRAVWP